MFASRTTTVLGAVVSTVGLALAFASSAEAWAWPADGSVLRQFSLGDDPYAGGQHRGVDIALEGARLVHAPVSGEVAFAGQVPTHGLTATIETDGYKVSLTHLGPILVRRGDRVAEGSPLAEAGPTGVSEHEVPYVHLGIRAGDDETYVDPLSLLPPRAVPIPPPTSAAPPASAPPASAPAPTPPLAEAAQPAVPESAPTPAAVPVPVSLSVPDGAPPPEIVQTRAAGTPGTPGRPEATGSRDGKHRRARANVAGGGAETLSPQAERVSRSAFPRGVVGTPAARQRGSTSDRVLRSRNGTTRQPTA
ncbi:MAG: M23 family metallopeptidase, partial [Actinomycetota bacterium]|nr:M23 family metallopeptidase [Actinomycetota bacterium]